MKLISISLSPNTEKDDIFLTLKTILQPWKWKNNSLVERLEKKFNYQYSFALNSGRSSLFLILKALNFKRGSHVVLQSFTCNAASNPIIWAGLIPIYIDCNEKDFNIDVIELKKYLMECEEKPKALIVQHTFGQPADMDSILEVCRENKIILIEDCAHSLGARYKGKNVGEFGDVSFFSFSRDKVISSVYGGLITTNKKEIGKKIEKLNFPSNFWTFQQLLHPLLMNSIIIPTYGFLGKYLLVLFQKMHILSKAVHWKEKIGEKPDYFPKKLPGALAILALNQLKKVDDFNNHRKKIADFYFQELKDTKYVLPEKFSERDNIYLRFTVRHPKAHKIIKDAWRNNILIGDWYTSPIAPDDTDEKKVYYRSGSCLNAEKMSKIVLNLPTHINISLEEAKKIINFIKKY